MVETQESNGKLYNNFTGGNTGFNFNSGSSALGGTGFGAGTTGFGGTSLFGQQSTAGPGGAVTLPSASNSQSQEMLQVVIRFLVYAEFLSSDRVLLFYCCIELTEQ